MVFSVDKQFRLVLAVAAVSNRHFVGGEAFFHRFLHRGRSIVVVAITPFASIVLYASCVNILTVKVEDLDEICKIQSRLVS